MAAITAAMVKELREITGSGMMDCKKALGATDGDMDKAVEWLRENGFMKAAKKAERIAAEGVCAAAVAEDGKSAAIVEVNSETDFVAKNEKFTTFANQVAAKALKTAAADIEAFLEEEFESGKSIKTALTEQIAVIGENMNIRRFAVLVENDGLVESYIHGSRIGVLVALKTNVVNEAVKEAARNVAMQIAAMRPTYLKEICLVDQVYVKDSSMTVQSYIDSVAKAEGADMALTGFVRFETGEGLEKKSENFAEEVAAQMGN